MNIVASCFYLLSFFLKNYCASFFPPGVEGQAEKGEEGAPLCTIYWFTAGACRGWAGQGLRLTAGDLIQVS